MTLRPFRLFIAAFLLLPLAPLPARQPTQKDAVAPVHARPALWRVKDKDTTIYLFGTIHLMKPNIVWFEGPVRKAYRQSGDVVVEVAEAPDPSRQAKIVQQALVPTGPTVTEQLPADLRPHYAALLAQMGPGGAMLDRVKPWFAALALTNEPLRKLGYDAASGVDQTIMTAARKDGKTLTGLETAEAQIALFADLPQDLQLLLLSETLREQDKLEETIGRMVAAWIAGDPVALATDMNESMKDSPDLMKRLLLDRNAAWADWIDERMKQPGTVFMAVGAGHLAGPGSVQEVLASRGIASVRVKR